MTTITMQIYIYVSSAWLDVTADTLDPDGFSSSWGMNSNKPNDFVAKTGTLNFTLKNSTGKYLPGGASVVSADWDKGTKVKAVFTYDGFSYVRFYGVVNKLDIVKIPPDNSNVRVSCVDWMNYAAKFPLQNPAIELDQRIDQAMTTIVDRMAIQPLNRDFSTGLNIFPTVFNDASQYTLGLSEFSKLAASEMSYIYVKKDKATGETLRVESAGSRTLATPGKQVVVKQATAYLLQENGDKLLQENGDKLLLGGYKTQDVSVNNTMTDIQVDYGENLINRVVITVNPTTIAETDTILFNLESPIYFDPGTEKEFNVQFTELNSKRLVAALPPDSNYPTSLLHFDVPRENGLIIDESGRTWNDLGVDIVGTVKKFGAGSLYLDGSDAYVYASSADAFEFGSGDFTVEWQEYRFSAASGYSVIRRSGAGGFVPWEFGKSDGTNSLIYISSNGSSWDIANGRTLGAIQLNTWVHYAVSRVGNTFYASQNGIITDSWTSSATILASTADIIIGGSGTCITACLDEMRITKGLGRYYGNFAPPSEAFSLSGLIYAAWDSEVGEGTELTDDFPLTVSYGGAGATVNVSNTGTVGGWLTDLKIFGKIVETTSQLSSVQEDADSIAEYSEHELIINQVYQQDFTSGREEGAKILETNKRPLLRVNSVTMNANRDDAHTKYFLETDIGDVVEVIEPVTETSDDFFIQGMSWKAQAGADGVIVDFSWILKRLRRALSPFQIQFADLTTNYNSVNFGYLPAVSVESTPARFWSYWYRSTNTRADAYHISTYSGLANANDRGYYIRITSAGGIRVLIKNGVAHNEWRSGNLPNVNNTWYHIAVYADTRSSAPARIFLDGVELATATLGFTRTTNNTSEVGTDLTIGGTTAVPAQNAKFKDVRIYNGDQVADPAVLAAALYAETPYGNANTTGLLFRTFYAPSNQLSSYEGDYLAEDMKVIDDVGQAAGTPVGSPLGEAV